jgi:hypothetical protein
MQKGGQYSDKGSTMSGVRQIVLTSIAAASLLFGCNRRPPPIQLQRPPIPKPDAAVVFSGGLTGTAVTLTPAAARRFVTIISAEPKVEETAPLKLAAYADFTVDGTNYGWYGDYIGLEKTQGHRQKWLTWAAPEFARMHQKLKDADDKNPDELYLKALSELEPSRPGGAHAE